jgi:hypothetical protein
MNEINQLPKELIRLDVGVKTIETRYGLKNRQVKNLKKAILLLII